ncbi:membrane protein insertion efficiency factor YidD [Sphingomonas oleivorans]|uniref:Putative membrane protein insertion efficiency factor n=1 Tax=Sphingomonas oleivorans TaxID=1735121 RepID=A0A2T5FV20_9SPHN|nr:membrane protein insertion efficiency factor YidD [Sphingomonas oleivorans]PTQ08585.1 membrane protein insertion efficiency factor YidD [Sphingomonas oleivorans]
MIARALILLAKAWQRGPSAILPPNCRYMPSCSTYAIEALSRYGAAKGGWLAARRILRCHPWGGHGIDPVP